MIDFTCIDDDLERTQSLPVLTPDMQLEAVLMREQAARLEIVELLRQNVQQAREIGLLRHSRREAFHSSLERPSHPMDRLVTTEEQLFEVCGALKCTLSQVLKECQARGLSFSGADAAEQALERSCDRLEQILSAPGFLSPGAAQAHAAEGGAILPAALVRPQRIPHLEALSVGVYR